MLQGFDTSVQNSAFANNSHPSSLQWDQSTYSSDDKPSVADSIRDPSSIGWSSQSPKSTTKLGRQNQAILAHARLWTISPAFDSDEDTRYEHELLIEPWVSNLTSLRVAAVSHVCPYLAFTSCSHHRVSGWKDGNSLYVALNGHYLTA
jgi:hypothetical protein